MIHLPDAPFGVGELDPVRILAPYVAGPVTVDNDVDWATPNPTTPGPRTTSPTCLGEGLGCAIVAPRSGGATTASRARSPTSWPGTRRPGGTVHRGVRPAGPAPAGSTAIDVDGLVAAVTGLEADGVGHPPRPRPGRQRRARRHRGAGRPAGGHHRRLVGQPPVILGTIVTAAERLLRPVPVRGAGLTGNPSLAGARTNALTRLRAAIIGAPVPPPGVPRPPRSRCPAGPRRSRGPRRPRTKIAPNGPMSRHPPFPPRPGASSGAPASGILELEDRRWA